MVLTVLKGIRDAALWCGALIAALTVLSLGVWCWAHPAAYLVLVILGGGVYTCCVGISEWWQERH